MKLHSGYTDAAERFAEKARVESATLTLSFAERHAFKLPR